MVMFMKKVWILFLIGIFLLCGCQKKEEPIVLPEEELEEVEEVVPTYQDENHTPISFYRLQGNTLTILHTISGSYAGLDEVGTFQIYPSNEEVISLPQSFAISYHDQWIQYNPDNKIKVGFSLSFTLNDGQEIFYNILSPYQAMDQWEYFMAYIYDDYQNMGKNFYSHIEPEEYQDSNLFTAIKIQCGAYFQKINSPVLFTVYTYDSDDDFLEGHYRGNSKWTITINNK